MNATPKAIDVNEKRLLITWDQPISFNARTLRQACCCASCISEITGKRTLDIDSIPENIEIKKAEPTGNYAISLEFSDGHKTGIYTWEFLLGLTR